jgi:crossover junction endodeoxyribonuclease RusA
MSTVIRFEVFGIPAPKGSYRAINVGGRAIMVPSGDDNRKRGLRSWDQAVRLAAREHVGPVDVPPFVDVPIRVVMVFRLTRPAGQWGKRGLKLSAPAFPATKPDIDKLARSTADSLKGIVYDDDSRIVEKRLIKLYAAPGQEGATIVVEQREPMTEIELTLFG